MSLRNYAILTSTVTTTHSRARTSPNTDIDSTSADTRRPDAGSGFTALRTACAVRS